MKKYVIVHLPVNVQNPTPIPPEQISEFMVNKNNLYYDLTPNTKIKGTLLSKYALPNDYIMDQNNKLIGQVENTITFQNVADLFLGETIFSLRQPLQDQIKFNQLTKHAYKKDDDQINLNNKKETPSWVIQYAHGKTVSSEQNIQLSAHESYFKDFLQQRKGVTMQLIEYLNKQRRFGLNTQQLLIILRKLGFQYTGGPFRQLWFIRGYVPQFMGEQLLNIQYQEFILSACQNSIRQLSQDQYNQLKNKYPKTFQQLELLFINNRIQIYKQFRDYHVFQQHIKNNETPEIQQIRIEIRQQMDIFFNNLLSITQFNEKEATDDVTLIDMQNIEKYDSLGPKIEEGEELQSNQGEELFEELEEPDYSYTESSSD